LDLGVVTKEVAGLPVGGVDEGLGDAFVGPVVGAAQVLPVAGLDAVEAEEAPVGVRELLDQSLLGGVGGIVGFEHAGSELFVIVVVLVREDGLFGSEAVAEGVHAGLGFSLAGFGAGGFEGVPAVGLDLFFGWHGGGVLSPQ